MAAHGVDDCGAARVGARVSLHVDPPYTRSGK
jgi:hypothetical protein